MKILDILTSPWAIVPDKLYEIQEIYSTHLRGEKIDIAGIEAKINVAPEDDEKRYQELIIGQFGYPPNPLFYPSGIHCP